MTHSQLVTLLKKPGKKILETLTPDHADMWHMTSCICGESGELFDAIKKLVIYNKPIDRANVIEELGDLEFYLEGLRQVLHISRKETIDQNIEKLSKRYGKMIYSDSDAQTRADKS